ncbi:hypothetical protein ACFYOT_15735 [Saccharothrix saharensis]|uniref:hypothetical protein n=1 Tax=Saccharothrix saharensis TaxID=571190 RepID=UPI00369D6161
MGKSSSGTAMTVAPADLGAPGDQLGKGGEATVYDLPDLTLPDVVGPLVYKRYRNGHASPQSLRRVVAARANLDEATRARLDAVTAWPVRVVEEQGQAVGIVMPRIPEPFFDRVVRNAGTKKSLREVQNLFIEPARALKVGRPAPSDEERLRICLDFTKALVFLHDELKIVFGDINPKNAVFRLDARPMVMFLDCDAVRPVGVVAQVRQLDAPDWQPPEGGNLTLASDRYKLGLFILRTLTPGAGSSVNTDPGAAARALDAEGLGLLRRALGRDTADRPSAHDWEIHLRRRLGEAVAPPRLGEVGVDRAFVLAGQSVTVEWEASEAREVEIVAGTRTERLDGRPGRGRTAVVLDESGWIRVRAINDLGVDLREVGPVTAVPPPEVRPLPVPLPEVRWPSSGAAGPPGLDLIPLPAFDLRVRLPEPPPVDGGRGVPWPSLPAPRAVGFPLDLRAMLTDSPEVDLGFPDGEETSR